MKNYRNNGSKLLKKLTQKSLFVPTLILLLFILNFAPSLASSKKLVCSEAFLEKQLYFNVQQEQLIDSIYKYGWRIGEDSLALYKSIVSESDARTLAELGFSISGDQFLTPSLSEMVRNYQKALDKRKIPANERILPAVVFSNDRRSYQEHYHIDGFFTPGVDKPLDISTDLNFQNIQASPESMLGLVSQGRYPIFSTGLHDVWHFVTFLKSPLYAKLLRAAYSRFQKLGASHGQISRLTYETESLALARADKASEIRDIITIKNPDGKSIADFRAAIESLPETEIIYRTQLMSQKFDSFLNIHAAGALNPTESRSFRNDAKRSYWFNQLQKPPQENPPEVDPNPFVLILEAPNVMSAVLSEHLRRYVETKPHPQNPDSRTITLSRLIDQLARMEYFLWVSSTQISMQKWMEDTLQEKLDSNSPTIQFIRDAFGESSWTYKKFIQP